MPSHILVPGVVPSLKPTLSPPLDYGFRVDGFFGGSSVTRL